METLVSPEGVAAATACQELYVPCWLRKQGPGMGEAARVRKNSP